MNLFLILKKIIVNLRKVDLIKTLYWNYRLFPFKIACLCPILIGHNVQLIGVKRGNIQIEGNKYYRGIVKIGISDYPQFPTKFVSTMIRLSNGSKVIFGENVVIGVGCSIVGTYQGKIIIGNHVSINMYSMLYCNKEIIIGNDVRIGWKSQIYDSNIHYLIDIESGMVKSTSKSIIISNNVWIANSVTIAPGARIPPYTTVAAKSLVNRDFTVNSKSGGLIVGIPGHYKSTGKVRIINEEIQNQIKTIFMNSREVKDLDINLIGYSQAPLDSSLNPLYRDYF